jgi:hypothetical protein
MTPEEDENQGEPEPLEDQQADQDIQDMLDALLQRVRTKEEPANDVWDAFLKIFKDDAFKAIPHSPADNNYRVTLKNALVARGCGDIILSIMWYESIQFIQGNFFCVDRSGDIIYFAASDVGLIRLVQNNVENFYYF